MGFFAYIVRPDHRKLELESRRRPAAIPCGNGWPVFKQTTRPEVPYIRWQWLSPCRYRRNTWTEGKRDGDDRNCSRAPSHAEHLLIRPRKWPAVKAMNRSETSSSSDATTWYIVMDASDGMRSRRGNSQERPFPPPQVIDACFQHLMLHLPGAPCKSRAPYQIQRLDITRLPPALNNPEIYRNREQGPNEPRRESSGVYRILRAATPRSSFEVKQNSQPPLDTYGIRRRRS